MTVQLSAGRDRPLPHTRSFLFIPGHNAGMLSKIASLGPDAFVVDFEDGVPLEKKQAARDNIRAVIAQLGSAASRPPLFVRINDLDSPLWLDDVRAVFEAPITGLVIPKFESYEKLAIVDRELRAHECRMGRAPLELILQLESMKGLRELFKDADSAAAGRLVALALGAEDFASTLSTFSAIDPDMIDFARRLLVLHARSLGVLAIDTVHADVKDLAGLASQSLRVARMGFDGKLAVHPMQIQVINSCLGPSADDIERVRRTLGHRTEIDERGAIAVQGVMLDRAHLNWALKVQKHWPGEIQGG